MKELIENSIKNPVAGNLLLVVLALAGILSYAMIPREVFPEFNLDMISVSMVYRGATPDEVAEAITTKIEERIAGIDGVKEIRSTSSEGSASVIIDVETGYNSLRVKDEIEREVNAITNFPSDAERPIIAEVVAKRPVVSLGIYGDVSLNTLKKYADEIRDELLSMPEFTQVEVLGVKEREISIEVSEETLQQHSLTLSQVASRVRQFSLNTAGGTIRSKQGEITVRTEAQKYTGDEYARIPLLSTDSGSILYLGDVATIRDSFEDRNIASTFNGKLAAVVEVSKTETQDSIALARRVREYADAKRSELPQSLTLIPWNDSSKVVQDRLDLLTRNGIQGLFLVLMFLGIFLEVRLAFFVALGIPICFLGTFLFMKMFGHTLNMLSMFAFIMVLGMVVDDAMVIGEAYFQKLREGLDQKSAAIQATFSMFWPVLASVSTTMVAFLPFYGIEGIMGKFFAITPFVIISTLFFSLVESYLILPAHLAHHAPLARGNNFLSRLQKRVHAFMDWHCDVVLRKAVNLSLTYRYAALALAISLLIMSGGLIAGGLVKFTFFPKIDEDFLNVTLEFPTGTDFEYTRQMTDMLEEKLLVAQKVMQERGREDQKFPFVKNIYANVGAGDSGKASLQVELLPSEERNIYYTEIFDEWRRQVGTIPEATKLVFGSKNRGPGGKPVAIQLRGDSLSELALAARETRQAMIHYPALKDISDNFAEGKLEAKLKLKPLAHTLGLSLSEVANQIRASYFGDQAVRIQRGKDDIRVYIRLPKEERQTLDSLKGLYIRASDGRKIPFDTIAEFQYERGYTTISRNDRFTEVTVDADIDEKRGNAREFVTDFSQNYLPQLKKNHPSVQFLFRGQSEETGKSLFSLGVGFGIALFVIYGILATIFQSYVQPVIIMLAIPFGFIGAILGHLLMGFDITIMSMFGLVALAGIVVNNSLVLLDLVNQLVRNGWDMKEALMEGSARRFMPIFLTSCTTFLGITPMLTEKSVQALFLQPMVVALAFGLLVSTFFTLLILPSIYLILYDVLAGLASFYRGRKIPREAMA